LVKKSIYVLIMIVLLAPISVSAEIAKETVSATLTATVKTNHDDGSIPIKNSRIIVINSLGEIIGNGLTNSEGIATILLKVDKDPRFPMKNMGEVTIIAVANGFNEHINFSVPVNEYDDYTARVYVPLWKIDPNRRNEPQFINGNFHRFTVFDMLDYYAGKVGLKRQNIIVDIGKEPPWSSDLKE
jgi:hypothetical protein